MGVHVIASFVSGVSAEDAPLWLEEALALAGRDVLARHSYPIGGVAPPWRDGTLHWEVLSFPAHGSTALRTYEVGASRWDPRFLRALSAVAGSFVEGLDAHRARDRYGAATMFAGRTIELVEWSPDEGFTGIGMPAHYPFVTGDTLEVSHRTRVGQLHDALLPGQPRTQEVVAAGEWTVSAPLDGFATDAERPTSRVLLAWLEEAAFVASLPELGAAGWQWRAGRTPALGNAYIEMACEGALDPELAIQWARTFDVPYVAFEIPGGGAAAPYAQGFGDGEEHRGYAQGAERLYHELVQTSLMLGEGIGTVFNGSTRDWHWI